MIIVIGAGISGLTLAKELAGTDGLVLEKENKPGGLSTQYNSGGYLFDYGGHYFHFQGLEKLALELQASYSFQSFKRRSFVASGKLRIPFPIQFHLSRLPAAIKKKVLEEILARDIEAKQKPANLREDLRAKFGPTLCDLFFYPFLEKFYQSPLTEISADMDKGTIPVPDRNKLISGARGKLFKGVGYNASFFYPRPGLADFIEKYGAKEYRRILTCEEVLAVDLAKKRITTRKNEYKYSVLCNTIPLKSFLALCRDHRLKKLAEKLRHISTLVFNAALQKRRRRFHWLYLPEIKYFCYRAGYYPYPDYTACYLEKTVNPAEHDSTDWQNEALQTLRKLGMIEHDSELLHYDAKVIPISYIVFDRLWHETVPSTLAWLEKNDVYCSGRFATWNYSSMSMDMLQARMTARRILAGSR